MDETLKALLTELAIVRENQERMEKTLNSIVADFNDFAERFEEVITQLEDERRLDLMGDNY